MITSGRGYRIGSSGGVILATVFAVLFANTPFVQEFVTTSIPVINRLSAVILSGRDLTMAVLLSSAVVFLCLFPLYKPRPRRVLDTIFLTQKRVLAAMFAIATLGYFNWSYQLPRATLGITMSLLLVTLPAWFVLIRSRPSLNGKRVIIVGDDMERIKRAATAIEGPVLGYLSPLIDTGERKQELVTQTDGGAADLRSSDLIPLGGLSRLDQVLVNLDVDIVLLAFTKTDRDEFFGVLKICQTHGVRAKVLREHADSVLFSLAENETGELLTIDLEPWDWQERLIKRSFDIAFALTGLVLFAPLLGLIGLAIKLDSPGSVFYSQNRTTNFGRVFKLLKFRTMLPDSESATPIDDDYNDRITNIGQLLRKSHLDELPQLWSILIGDMSVVGPRAVWTEEETLLEEETKQWRKRWFVKPGLTGLAQINDVSSTNPRTKLQYDLEYIRQQSFWFDLKIVIRQIWTTLSDVYSLVRGRNHGTDDR